MQTSLEKRAFQEHGLIMENRRRAIVTGVEEVECFNEEMVILSTGAGSLTVTGSGLNIPELRLDEGRLVIEGELSTAEYEGRLRSGKGGFFSRLFK